MVKLPPEPVSTPEKVVVRLLLPTVRLLLLSKTVPSPESEPRVLFWAIDNCEPDDSWKRRFLLKKHR